MSFMSKIFASKLVCKGVFNMPFMHECSLLWNSLEEFTLVDQRNQPFTLVDQPTNQPM